MKRFLELFFITALFILICFVYKGQARLSLNEGKGWDGMYYYKMTEQILQGDYAVTGELPFVKRVGTPFLMAQYARLTGSGLLESATIVNLMGIYLTVILLVFWLRIFIDRFWLRGLLCFLFMMGWYLPLRIGFYDSVASDAWGAVWFMSGVLLLDVIRKAFCQKRKMVLLFYVLIFSIVVAVGNLFRESNAVLCVALFFVLNPLKEMTLFPVKAVTLSGIKSSFKKTGKLYATPQTILLFIPILVVGVVNWIVSNHIHVAESDYSYIKALFFWFYKKSLSAYLLGVLNAVGPLLLLLPFYFKEMKSILWERQELLVLLILSFFFGYFAGGDTERIFFMSGFPMLLVWMGFAIKNIFESSKRWWLYVLLALQTIAFRFYWFVPDCPNDFWNTPFPFFTLLGSHFQYLFLYSYHGQYILNSLILAEYFVLFIITWYILRKQDFKALFS